MATLTVKHGSTVEFIKQLKAAKFTEEQIEILARRDEEHVQQIEQIVENTSLTKNDLAVTELKLQKEIEIVRKEIIQASNKIIIWVAGLLVASGFIQHFIK
jgi:hypothetical protein